MFCAPCALISAFAVLVHDAVFVIPALVIRIPIPVSLVILVAITPKDVVVPDITGTKKGQG
jgi:hypothetical protein